MKKVTSVAAVAAFAMFGASAAFAQTATQTIDLSANVVDYCTVGGGATSNTTATIPVSGGLPVIAPVVVGGLGGVTCNENTTLTLTSLNGGVLGPAAAGPFSNRIDYTAVATYGALSQTLTTSGAAGATSGASAASTSGASNSTSFGVTVTPATPASTLMAGAYADTLTVLFTPTP